MDYLRKCALTFVFVGLIVASGCEPASPSEGPEGSSKFLVVGAEGTILSSLDGTRWTTEASGVSVNLTSVTTGRSVFVAAGSSGTILTSPDGISWTQRNSQTMVNLTHVIFNGEKFVAVGGSWESGAVTVKSIDGTTWTQVESPSTYMFHAVAHVGSTLVAAAYYRSDLQTPALFTSTVLSDSSSTSGWTQRQGPDFYDSLTAGDEIMVVGGITVSTSRDGATWTERQLPSAQPGTGIASSGSAFVIVGELGTIYSSSNGIDWSTRSTTLGRNWLRGVTHGDSMFVAVGGSGVIVTSPDGTAWTTQVGGITKNLYDVAYGPIAP